MDNQRDPAKYVAAVYAVIACLLLVFPTSKTAHSLRVLFSYTLYPTLDYGAKSEYYLRNIPKNILNLLKTDQENRRLSFIVKDNKISLNYANTLIKENERLSNLLRISPSVKWKGTWARVVNRNPVDSHSSFFINKGANDGININSTVIAVHGENIGLVGRIFEVYNDFSKVMLITNKTFSTIGAFGRMDNESLVEGTGGELLKMAHIPVKAEITEGMNVSTSKTSILFPQGILIGKVSKVYPKKMFMSFLVADISPAAGIDSVKEVYVISRKLSKEIEIIEGKLK